MSPDFFQFTWACDLAPDFVSIITAKSTPRRRFMRELSEWHASRHDLPVEGDPNLGRCQVGEKRRLFVSDKCPYFLLPKANVIDDDDL